MFDAHRSTLSQLLGADAASALKGPPAGHDEQLAATRAWLDGDRSRHIIVLGDAAYPPLLLETADPPLMLYAQGRVELLQAASIAVVGSRNPTAQGGDNARAFARHLSQAGLAVVSGMALGIDGAAHDGALAGPAGTIAVMGTGADRIYPARHRALAHRIAAEGLLLTEFEIGVPPLA